MIRIPSLRPFHFSTPRFQPTLLCRSYYSPTSAPEPISPFAPTQSAILSSAIQHVPTHGFTAEALRLGAKDAGYLDVSVQLFPRGAFDLVNYYRVTRRLALKDRVRFFEEDEAKKMGVGKKVRTLVRERLRMNREDRIGGQLQAVS